MNLPGYMTRGNMFPRSDMTHECTIKIVPLIGTARHHYYCTGTPVQCLSKLNYRKLNIVGDVKNVAYGMSMKRSAECGSTCKLVPYAWEMYMQCDAEQTITRISNDNLLRLLSGYRSVRSHRQLLL